MGTFLAIPRLFFRTGNYLLCKGRDRSPLRSTPTVVPISRTPMFVSVLVGFFHRSLQPHLDQMQHGSVHHPTGNRLKKLGMRNTIEVTAEVCVNNFLMASIDQLVDTFDRVQRAAVSPIGVLFRLQIGLEDGFEHQNCRHFRRPVTDGGYS